MAEFGVIRLRADTELVEWIKVDSTGTRLSGISSGSLSDAKSALSLTPVIVLLPAPEVLTTRIDLPLRSAAKIRAALPFALEESLADDIDSLHFAAGNRGSDGTIPVAIVAHDRLNGWLLALADAGITPVRVIAENQALPSIPGSLSLLVDTHCTMFNDGARTEFVLSGSKPSDVLIAAGVLNDEDAPSTDESDAGTHLLVFCDAETKEDLTHDWNALRHELDSVDLTVVPDGVFAKLAIAAASGLGVNLLQGPYGKKTEYQALFKPWRLAASLFAALILVGFVGKVADYYRLTAELDALKEQFSAEYRAIRPGDTREVRDPVGTLRSLAIGTGSRSSAPQVFLPSIAAIGAAVSSNKTASVEALSYRAGVTDLRLTTEDVRTLDRIQSEISSGGTLSANIQSTDNVADRINGRIQVREAQ